MIRVGILSFAHLHAEAYVGNLRANPHVQLIGIADEDHPRGQHFAQVFSTPLYDSYEALLADRPDGVIVCSENARHRPLVELAASRGVHVLCEKPLATTVADAEAMVATCHSAGVRLMTAFPMRFSTPLQEIRKGIHSGTFGRIYAVNSVNTGECPRHHRAWFVDKTLAGGGALSDHVVHLADVLAWYTNQEVTEVYATANNILYPEETGVETGGIVMLCYADGTFATIDCSWSKPPYYPTWGGLSFEMITERGLVTANAFRQVMTVYSHSMQRPRYAYWGSDANQAMIDEFVNCIRENRPPAVTGEDGLRAVRIVEAAYRSVAAGAAVPLLG
jgi:predicted dehydrogenase